MKLTISSRILIDSGKNGIKFAAGKDLLIALHQDVWLS